MRKPDIEDLAHYSECAAQLARTVDEVIQDGVNTPESYSLSLFGVSYLMDFIATRLDEISREQHHQQRGREALPGNDR